MDPDALKVLYRLKESGYVACLVGGSVRDLLVGRRPKDFDIGTSAHPYQVKRLFRNCWIIGRRFRLAHIKFGNKVIEVATFRRQVPVLDADDVQVPGAPGVTAPTASAAAEGGTSLSSPRDDDRDLLIRRDNTFGTPEEDAFRRDFTINALFYDIATFSIIDYVGGLDDLRAGVVRCIGDPSVRFREDPVRMQRAASLAARLDFTIEPATEAAIRQHCAEIARSAPARLIEEYYKVLRSGAAARALRRFDELGLIEPVSAELHQHAGRPLWKSLDALDRYRRRFGTIPETLTNPILLGSVLVPLGFRVARPGASDADEPDEPMLGLLPIPRRDRERLRQILALQRRLQTTNPTPRLVRSLMSRASFGEALTWMEIHGQDPASLERWRELTQSMGAATAEPARRRRRRRRRKPPSAPVPTE